MSKLQLLLLGHFDCLLFSGQRISLSMRKAEVLLAFLALAPGIRHPRERLVNLLWSERGEEQARNSLRQCLSAIRKTLGDAAELLLQVDRTTVMLNAELVDVDAHEFERRAASAEIESLTDAAALYRGEFLEGISIRGAACQEWLDGERSRFKRQYIEILSNLARTLLASRDLKPAIRTAERLVEQDPLNESGWRLLMSIYHANGDRSLALQAFQRCQRILQQELEVAAEAATVELRAQIAQAGGKTAAVPDPPVTTRPGKTSGAAADDYSVAVLPFDNLSGGPEQEYFSDGITARIIAGLGGFKELAVRSRNSSFAYRHSKLSSVEIAAALKADYLVEGSIRKSRNHVRLSVQLIEAESDKQIWGKQYDAELEDILELEQQLSGAIAGTISGRIGHTLQKSASHKPAKNLRSYDYLLRGLYHFGRFTARNLETARDMFGKCLAIDPDNATAHTNLGTIHVVELMENWSSNRKQSEEFARHHLETAIELDPENALAHAYLSEYLMIIRKDYAQSEFHADKAIACNPTASEGYVAKADLLGMTRRVDEAVPYADKALQLDPHSVGAGWAAGAVYREAGFYQKSIKTFRSIDHPPASVHALIAACFLQMELIEEAHQEMGLYRQLATQEMPSYPDGESQWRSFWCENVPYQYEEDFEAFFNLLLEAGLLDQSAETTKEVPSIAVLPFENMSDDPEQAFFSDGITADIIATLSRFKHLRIVARHSTEIYRERKASIAEIAHEQNVRYILEGSVRRSDNRIRVSAELIDSHTEQNCWSERYDRNLDDLFMVQDEMTRSITLAMKIHLDDGEKAMLRSAGTDNIKAWELTLTAVDLQDTYIQQNIIDSRALLQQAIALDPDYCFAWIFLGWTHWQEAYSGWCESFEESMQAAQAAVEKALELEPGNGEAWSLQGTLHLMKHEPDEAIAANRKALELEPGNAEVQALAGFALNFVGEYEKAGQHFHKALRLSPVCPNWYYLIGARAEIGGGNLEQGIELLRRGVEVETDSPLVRFYLASALIDKGDEAAARRVAAQIRQLDKYVTGKGLVQSYSRDGRERERFRHNLESLDLA